MDDSLPASDKQLLQAALLRFDEENARDPNFENSGGGQLPRELAYAQWLTDWVLRLKPDASPALRLAARSAHLCRWTIPRDSYPLNRSGYLRWRQELKKFHATKVSEILNEVGFAQPLINQVQALVSKAAFPSEPDSRVLEDALCLVFLERQFGPLARKNPDDKMINALQKTWKKMTPLAQEYALKLDYRPRERDLLERALRPL